MHKVYVRIANRIATIERPYDYDALIKHWSFMLPGAKFFAHRYHNWDGSKKLLVRDKLPAGLFWATYKDIEKELGIKFKVRAELAETKTAFKWYGLVSEDKYKFQNACVDSMIAAYPKGGGLILNATASGKTRTAAMFFSQLRGSAVFVVDELHLMEQSRKELAMHLGEKVGIVGNSIFDPRRVTVATIQTLHRHRFDKSFEDWINEIDVNFIDEIHVQLNRRNWDVVRAIPATAVYGLTATLEMNQKPVRLQAYATAGPVLYQYPLARGMQEGVLSAGGVVRITYENHVPMTNRKWPWQEQYTEHIVYNDERNALVEDLVKYCYKKKRFIILMVERVKHLKKMSKRLASIPHQVAYGEREVADRIKASKKFDKGELRLIIANKVFKKGVNVKRIDAIVSAAGLKSKNDAIQIFGRGIRTFEGKHGLMFFDIADIEPSDKDVRRENREITKENKRIMAFNKKLHHGKFRKALIRKKKLNRFNVASGQRKNAYKKAGIQVLDVDYNAGVEKAYAEAESLVKKVVKQLRKPGANPGR